jgi:uncharacterized protein YihD (DUF1040 family)
LFNFLENLMKKLLSLLIVAFGLTLGVAHAAEEKKMSQGQKMGACAKEASAKGLKGDEANKFKSECSKADAKPAAAPMTQGQKMGACSKEAAAKGLKGDEANKFKSECAKAK